MLRGSEGSWTELGGDSGNGDVGETARAFIKKGSGGVGVDWR